MEVAPIALFVYKRPEHTRQTLAALKANHLAKDSDLIIFSDAPRSGADAHAVAEVRQQFDALQGFKSVSLVARESNLGLADSIIDGVGRVCRDHGRVIVLEDDLVTSPYFLSYMNEGLQRYEAESRVASIHGYVYPCGTVLPETFFLRGADCWGWATWARAWQDFNADGDELLKALKSQRLTRLFDFDGTADYVGMLEAQIAGKNDSWAIRWYASTFLLNKLTLYPGKSLVLNIGMDDSGTHCQPTDAHSGELCMTPVPVRAIAIEDSTGGRDAFTRYFREGKVSLAQRVWKKMSSMVKRV
ncbi:glycosyl transferase [Herbaspirillum sp. meg3]|uniref:glycosyltransferase n=1 Tax=Herbaspirillum sp. meg3 TaxID=2025949 RepID=UPI000B98626C|nr:glycosyltransferase [Herbaspirillum sp. meg3]ASU40569.1 glycosyl transferase [Herbaspirillum sp. meg3]